MSTTQRDKRGSRAKRKNTASNQKTVANHQQPMAHQLPAAQQLTSRQQQRAKQRRKTTSSSSRRLLFWAIASLILAIAAAVGIFFFTQSQAASGELTGVVTYSNLSRQHVSGKVNYPQNPPVGGNHNPVWQNCGMYSTAIANENAVHSLEHGAVWVTYQPSLGQQDVEQLRSLLRGHSYILLSPYPGLPSPVVISAWGVQLQVKSASDPRLALFLTKYEQGPQTPEPGASCASGTGTPDQQ